MPLSNCVAPPVVDLPGSSSSSARKANSSGGKESVEGTGMVGLISGASGSARWQGHGVDVVCAVYGPMAPQKSSAVDMKARVDCELRYAPYVTKPRSGTSEGGQQQQLKDSHANADSLEKYMSSNLIESIQSSLFLEKYPKMLISIVINIQSSSQYMGLDLSAATVCASLALANASIEMRDLVSASTLFFSHDGSGTFHEHLDHGEYFTACKSPFGMMSVATMHNRNEIVNVIFEGRASGTKMSEMIQKCCEKNATLRVRMEDAIASA